MKNIIIKNLRCFYIYKVQFKLGQLKIQPLTLKPNQTIFIWDKFFLQTRTFFLICYMVIYKIY